MNNRRQDLRIDGHPVIWQENFWLHPSVGVVVPLTAGRHRVQVSATQGEPRLAWRRVKERYTGDRLRQAPPGLSYNVRFPLTPHSRNRFSSPTPAWRHASPVHIEPPLP